MGFGRLIHRSPSFLKCSLSSMPLLSTIGMTVLICNQLMAKEPIVLEPLWESTADSNEFNEDGEESQEIQFKESLINKERRVRPLHSRLNLSHIPVFGDGNFSKLGELVSYNTFSNS